MSFGAFFLFLGVLLFFDGPLLALGNVLFTGGITLLIGPQKTFYFFARKQKIRGTICFFLGMFMVFAKWAIIGMIVEVFGFINLFGDFFPVILNFLRQLPFIGNVLNAPGVRGVGVQETEKRVLLADLPFCPSSQVLDKLAGARQSAV